MTVHPSATGCFHNDQPIQSSENDLLGRSDYAASIAKQLMAYKQPESLVLGLAGEWGSGKTSLKNLIIENLRKSSKNLDILEFNPWQISGHESLTGIFFKDLAQLSLRGEAHKSGKYLATCLTIYALVAGFVGPALKMYGIATADAPSEASQAASVIADMIDSSKQFAENASKATKFKDLTKLSLSEIKAELNNEIAKRENKILVIIDDIDRLTSIEIKEIFQLVKSNADFPNTIFLLMFDRDAVVASLDGICNNKGQAYLEKIVQVLLHVPASSPSVILKILAERLNKIEALQNTDNHWDSYRWNKLWPQLSAVVFPNLRNVYRVISSFEFHISEFFGDGILEVNPLDAFILESIRVVHPQIWETIIEEKELLLGDKFNSPIFGEKTAPREKAEEAIKELLSSYPDTIRTEIGIIIEELFPRAFHHIFREDSYLSNMRACHSHYFDRYFRAKISDGEVRQWDVRNLIDNLNEPELFFLACEKLKQTGRLEITFQSLSVEKFSVEKNENMIVSLINAADLFLPEPRELTLGFIDCRVIATIIVTEALNKIRNKDHRYKILSDSVKKSRGLNLVVELGKIEDKTTDYGYEHSCLDEAESQKFLDLVVKRIVAAAKSGDLEKFQDWDITMHRWKRWEPNQKNLKSWLRSRISSSIDALWLLSAFLNSRTSGGERTFWIDLSEVEKLIAISRLKKLLSDTDKFSLDARQLEVFKAYETALKAIKNQSLAEKVSPPDKLNLK